MLKGRAFACLLLFNCRRNFGKEGLQSNPNDIIQNCLVVKLTPADIPYACLFYLRTSWPLIPWSGQLPLFLSVNKQNCGIRFLEHVEIQIDLTFPRRGYLELFSESPRGTQSKLLYSRAFDSLTGRKNFTKWTVSSLHYWGEDPNGDWKITMKNSKPDRKTRKSNILLLNCNNPFLYEYESNLRSNEHYLSSSGKKA